MTDINDWPEDKTPVGELMETATILRIRAENAEAELRQRDDFINSILSKMRAEIDKREFVLPGSPNLVDELIAQLEYTEARAERLAAAISDIVNEMRNGDSSHMLYQSIHRAEAALSATDTGERWALGQELIAWAAEEQNALGMISGDWGETWWCRFCDDDYDFRSKERIFHDPDCLHLRAKALQSYRPADPPAHQPQRDSDQQAVTGSGSDGVQQDGKGDEREPEQRE